MNIYLLLFLQAHRLLFIRGSGGEKGRGQVYDKHSIPMFFAHHYHDANVQMYPIFREDILTLPEKYIFFEK